MIAPALYVAPLEGLTGWNFRLLHHRLFPGANRYYTPFLSPIEGTGLTPRALREVLPSNNQDIPLVPQLLTNRPDCFLDAAFLLAGMGYREVNLNLGCPSGTVVSKGKASGMLNDPDAVDRLLDGIFEKCPIAVSVKTRIGRFDADEWEPLMEVYNRYPITELTIHPRIRMQMYRGKPNMEAFAYALSSARMPICYNGDIFSPEDASDLLSAFPGVSALMVGRGLIANPGLIREIRGMPRVDAPTLRAFHDAILAETEERLSGSTHVLHRMKELWFYLIQLFEDADRHAKRIRKSLHMSEYRSAVDRLFDECTIGAHTAFCPPSEP